MANTTSTTSAAPTNSTPNPVQKAGNVVGNEANVIVEHNKSWLVWVGFGAIIVVVAGIVAKVLGWY